MSEDTSLCSGGASKGMQFVRSEEGLEVVGCTEDATVSFKKIMLCSLYKMINNRNKTHRGSVITRIDYDREDKPPDNNNDHVTYKHIHVP